MRREVDEIQQQIDAQVEKNAKERQQIKFGERVGASFHDYTYKGLPNSQNDAQRDELATAILDALENGTREEKIRAIAAILATTEAFVGPIISDMVRLKFDTGRY